MKTKYPSMFGVLAALLLVASFIIPTSLASPSPVQAGVCKWDQVEMPGSIIARFDVGWIGPTDVQKIVVGNDGTTVLAVVNFDFLGTGVTFPYLLVSPLMGILWDHTAYLNLLAEWTRDGAGAGGLPFPTVFDVAIAPDNPKFWAVVVQDPTSLTVGPREVYVTENGGGKWKRTRLIDATAPATYGGSELVGAIDISVDYGGQRDIAVGMREGAGALDFSIFTIQTAGFAGWNLQTTLPNDIVANGDIYALKFSPTYPADGAIAVVFTTDEDPIANNGTYYNVALRDIDQNNVNQWAFAASIPVGLATTPDSPEADELISADLELPSDFNGQAASLRRAYVSTYADIANLPDQGIYRFDNQTVYVLMDTTTDVFKKISSIAYFGTYASGKLLAGSVFGYSCEASVPTWFTDSPTTCPIPCWYDCLKCPTGAAICPEDDACLGEIEVGNAQVVWFQNGALAFAATGTYTLTPGADWWEPYLHDASATPNDETAISISRNNGETWNQLAFIDTTIDAYNDFAMSADCNTLYLASYNNGCAGANGVCEATWTVTCGTDQESSSIDLLAGSANCTPDINPTLDVTTEDIDYHTSGGICGCTYHVAGTFTVTCEGGCTREVAFDATGTADCGSSQNITVELPYSCGACAIACCPCAAFDSVWRASLNPAVVGPLPPIPPLGYWYERVYTRPTALNCEDIQSDLPLLRLAGYCEEPTGQIVGWAAQGTTAQAWSPDYGDYWANITARDIIQDFAFESQTILYNLYIGGTVQKLPYTGTAWGTTLPAVNTAAAPGHTIAAMPEGKVLVGYTVGGGAPFPASISTDGGTTFAPLMQPLPMGENIHVAFDPDFNNNNMVYIGDDADGTGHVYRAMVANPFGLPRWADSDLMADTNNAEGCPDPNTTNGIYGLAVAYTGGTLYAADGCDAQLMSGVWRTLTPLVGIPKPGIYWDRLDVFTPNNISVCFTLEPYSLKLCGCCTLDTDTTLYALDNAAYSGLAHTDGFLWAFTDCMAKQGPALITEDKALIGCDPVSGRAAEVNLCWEQLCVAEGYDIEIGKDTNFTIKVLDWVTEGACSGYLVPASITSPCAYIPAGGSFADDAESDDEAMGSAVAFYGQLECGHVYYWRVKVRECVTGEDIRSPWSEVRSFSVKAGLPVVSAYSGLQLLAPANGAMGVSISKPSFSWSPIGESTKYKFVLATDAAMTQVVSETEVASTSYAYDGNLEYNTNYFWRVMALEPAPSDWSAIFSFRTEAAPEPVTPEKPAPTPVWVWVVIAIGAILVIVTLVLIFKTRRV